MVGARIPDGQPAAITQVSGHFSVTRGRSQRVDNSLANLEENPEFWKRAVELGVLPAARRAKAAESIRHFERHWLRRGLAPGEEPYFPNVEPERVLSEMKRGFARALTAARRHDLPLQVRWVHTRSHTTKGFTVRHTVEAKHVTVTIDTPHWSP